MKYVEAAIGRVVVHADHRRGGLGSGLMRRAIDAARATFGAKEPIRIGAQAHLQQFYGGVGFQACVGTEYDEDGIPHIEMLLLP